MTSGGRLAVTFYPETAASFQLFSDREQAESPLKKAGAKTGPAKPGRKKGKREEQEDRRLLRRTSLTERWGLDFGYLRPESGKATDYGSAVVRNHSQLSLPDTLEWHSAIIFTNLASSWRTIYARGTNPVVVERKFGSGTVVLASDSYFLSNEALRKDRHADLLAWWIGPGRQILFDEAHFGIVENEGIAALIGKYRLHGFVASLMLLAGLFLWKNSLVFIPPLEPRKEDFIAGKEAFTGFVNLLRRNIRKRDLLDICFAEWEKSFRKNVKQTSAKYSRAESIVQAHKAGPQNQNAIFGAYRELCQLLKKI